MKKKISELELYEVDYFVALAENSDASIVDKSCHIINIKDEYYGIYSPTTNPSQAWTIIEREKIELTWFDYDNCFANKAFDSDGETNNLGMNGKTSLESAMRCFACSVYGEEIEI